MHLIVAEKNISARRIAQILSGGKKVAENKDAGVSTYSFGDTMTMGLRGHVVEYLAETDDIHGAIERLAAFIFLQPKPFIPVFFQAIATMPRNPAFLREISALFDENSALFVQELARFRERGQIPADVDLVDAARAIYCMTIGLGLSTHMLGKDAEVSRRIWIDTVERILHIVPANRA